MASAEIEALLRHEYVMGSNGQFYCKKCWVEKRLDNKDGTCPADQARDYFGQTASKEGE